MPTEKDIAISPDVKVLVMAPPKSGKTVAVICSAPPPIFVLNADPGGLVSAKRHGGRFTYEDVFSVSDFKRALIHIDKVMQSDRPYRTIIVDTATILAENIESELAGRLSGFELFGELKRLVAGSLSRLFTYSAHVILTAHAITSAKGDAGEVGTIPMISGQSKNLLPALCNEWLWLELTPGQDSMATKREFLVGPQGNWKHGCRSLKFQGRINADYNTGGGIGKFIKMVEDEVKGDKRDKQEQPRGR